MTGEKIKQLLVAKNIVTLAEMKGCDESEIAEIERDIGSLLPKCYREFLLTMGRGAGELYSGTDIFYPALLELRKDAENLLLENQEKFMLSSTSFVISMHQGYAFEYIDLSQGDDPPVSQYVEGSGAPTVVWDSFMEFILDGISKCSIS